MKTKRLNTVPWRVECKRGRYFAVDAATGRRIKAHDFAHAALMATRNNRRELDGLAKLPAALVWG